MLSDDLASRGARHDADLENDRPVFLNNIYRHHCTTKTLNTIDCRKLISSSAIIAEISNIPIGGISRWSGKRIGLVTFITKARKVLRVKTNQNEINRMKMNNTKMLSSP